MRFEVRPDSRDLIFLNFSNAAAEKSHRKQSQASVEMPADPHDANKDEAGADQHGWITEKCGSPRRRDQQRSVTSVKPFIDSAIDRTRAAKEHREPGSREQCRRNGHCRARAR